MNSIVFKASADISEKFAKLCNPADCHPPVSFPSPLLKKCSLFNDFLFYSYPETRMSQNVDETPVNDDEEMMDRDYENNEQKPEKMFTLKKWNAVAMWSWDVECDTCAICRVQVMGNIFVFELFKA
ncbi:UNVERIFIED_CONTAM: RING-box protein 2 [Trichonephila clavipes]